MLRHSQQAESSLFRHTVLAWASSLLLHRALSVTFSYCMAHYNPLYLCVCAHAVRIQRLGVGGQGDFTVSLRTIPLLMHLSALCVVNEGQYASGRQKEDEMEGVKKVNEVEMRVRDSSCCTLKAS